MLCWTELSKHRAETDKNLYYTIPTWTVENIQEKSKELDYFDFENRKFFLSKNIKMRSNTTRGRQGQFIGSRKIAKLSARIRWIFWSNTHQEVHYNLNTNWYCEMIQIQRNCTLRKTRCKKVFCLDGDRWLSTAKKNEINKHAYHYILFVYHIFYFNFNVPQVV